MDAEITEVAERRPDCSDSEVLLLADKIISGASDEDCEEERWLAVEVSRFVIGGIIFFIERSEQPSVWDAVNKAVGGRSANPKSRDQKITGELSRQRWEEYFIGGALDLESKVKIIAEEAGLTASNVAFSLIGMECCTRYFHSFHDVYLKLSEAEEVKKKKSTSGSKPWKSHNNDLLLKMIREYTDRSVINRGDKKIFIIEAKEATNYSESRIKKIMSELIK